MSFNSTSIRKETTVADHIVKRNLPSHEINNEDKFVNEMYNQQ